MYRDGCDFVTFCLTSFYKFLCIRFFNKFSSLRTGGFDEVVVGGLGYDRVGQFSEKLLERGGDGRRLEPFGFQLRHRLRLTS